VINQPLQFIPIHTACPPIALPVITDYHGWMKTPLTTIFLSFVFFSMPVVLAHHSVVGVFNPDNEFNLTGIITDVEWINPHTYIHLDVYSETEDEANRLTKWQLESAPTAFLTKAGVTRTMLLGDGKPVTITGIAARNEDLKSGWIYRITYDDGHFYQLSAARAAIASGGDSDE
jgi:hypothetical protein